MIRRPPRSTRTDTLFPYTTLFRSMSQARLTEPALTALDSVGLEPRAHTRASDMAHGQQRQLELAMVLAGQPKLLLLDEPMAGMSQAESSQMTELLANLKGRYGIVLVADRKRVVWGKSVSVRVDLGGSRRIKKKKNIT